HNLKPLFNSARSRPKIGCGQFADVEAVVGVGGAIKGTRSPKTDVDVMVLDRVVRPGVPPRLNVARIPAVSWKSLDNCRDRISAFRRRFGSTRGIHGSGYCAIPPHLKV